MTVVEQPLSGDRPPWADPYLDGDACLYDGDWCQRSSYRIPTWRRTSEGGFDPRRYIVTRIGHRDAVAFVQTHHYSGCFPSVKLRYGLVERHDHRLVGVCTIGTPCNQKVLSNPLPKLAAARQVAELNRLVVLDEVASNGDRLWPKIEAVHASFATDEEVEFPGVPCAISYIDCNTHCGHA